MSQLAWKILSILMKQACYYRNGDDFYTKNHFAAWHLGAALGGDALTIQHVNYPHTPEEHALRELIDLKIVEELPDLHYRYRLVLTKKVEQDSSHP